MDHFGEAVILCGGKSKRMGFDKSLLKINGRYMIDILVDKLSLCFDRVKLSGGERERLGVFDLEIIEDEAKAGVGPAVGIYSALKQTSSQYVFVTACDMPFIEPAHIQFMMDLLAYHKYTPEALVPMNGGFIEPLYSFYSAGMAERFEEEILRGNYKIHDILLNAKALYMDDRFSRIFSENMSMFTNLNYTADLEHISLVR
ncbi:MAG: molybdenum cofactor guanylyltransferase [Clostridiales bacterium]|nr:molybdenum cofactor guanylyltransferase [Clostridiales bacterium]